MTDTTTPILPGLISDKQFQCLLGVSQRTAANYRALRKGPPFYKIANRIYYKEAEVLEWVERQKIETSSMHRKRG